MKLFAAASVALCTMLASPLVAQSNPVVVELFTSQGCSSCPPADKLLLELTGRDDVIPLALHVDYWDYIGWKDSFARSEHTTRQREYAQAGGRKMIYTPQMIVNGQQDVVGAHAMAVADLIAAHKAVAPAVSLTVTRNGNSVDVHADPLRPLSPPLTILMVRYTPLQTVEITRGENRGHTLDYANVVEGWVVLGQWNGSGPLRLTAKVDGPEQAAILIQSDGPGAILAAARVD